MPLQIFKIAHIISVIAWFAGIFYLPRLLVYDAEAPTRDPQNAGPIQAQLRLMQRKLYRGIMWPAMISSWMFGLSLMIVTGAQTQAWFWYKFALVCLVTLYHFFCGKLIQLHQENRFLLNGKQLRIFNELPTVLLVGIIFSVILKDMMNLNTGVILGLMSVVLLLEMMRRAR